MSISQQAAPLQRPRARLPRAGAPSGAGRSRPGLSGAAAPVRLQVVAPADSRASNSGAFVAACVLVMALGLAALLLLNTERAQQSFTISSLQASSATYTNTQQGLRSTLQRAQSPASLAARAHALGMAPASKIRYVGPDGKTVGVANGAAGSVPFTVGPLTTGGAAKVAGTASVGASLGARVGAPAPAKPVVKKPVTKTPAAKKPAAGTAKKPAAGTAKKSAPKESTTKAAKPGTTSKTGKSKTGTSTTQR